MSKDLKNKKNNVAAFLKRAIIYVIILTVIGATFSIINKESVDATINYIDSSLTIIIICYVLAEVIQILHDIRRKLYDKEVNYE